MQSLSHRSVTASSPEAAPPLSLRDVSPTGSTFTKGSLKFTKCFQYLQSYIAALFGTESLPLGGKVGFLTHSVKKVG